MGHVQHYRNIIFSSAGELTVVKEDNFTVVDNFSLSGGWRSYLDVRTIRVHPEEAVNPAL